MILVCDNEVNERTKALRKKLYDTGFPSAAVSVGEIRDYLPAKLIVCYYEAFDNIRRGPYDNIFAIVIGNGFVNSALNAIRVDNEDEACVKAKEYLHSILDIETYAFGVLTDSAVFIAKNYMEIFGNFIMPTLSEFMIFKYFLAFADDHVYLKPAQIRKYCYIREPKQTEENPEGLISVHIHNLNKRLINEYGKPFIKAKRFIGYYTLEL